MRKSVVIAFICAIPLVLFACGDSSSGDSSSIPDLDPSKYPAISTTSDAYKASSAAISAVDAAIASAMVNSDGTGSEEVAKKTCEMITHRTSKVASGESESYNFDWSENGVTVKGTYTADKDNITADINLTFTNYKSGSYTFNGTVHYLIKCESEEEIKYYYDSNITFVKDSASHTVKFQYVMDVTNDGMTYKAVYDYDGTKYGYQYKYPEATAVSEK